jgi:hypothetical protein
MGQRKLTDDKQIVDDYLTGMPLQTVAERHGVSRDIVRGRLAECGHKPRRSGWTGRGREQATQWKGGVARYPNGSIAAYKLYPEDPFYAMAQQSGYVSAHRLVMARAIGRALYPHETVHHINGDHYDNRIENLQLRIGKHGAGQAYRCLNCGSQNVEAVGLG